MSAIYRSEAGAEEIRRRYRDALGDWPVPAEQVRVPTRQGETFVVVSGPQDAPPMVLLPVFPDDTLRRLTVPVPVTVGGSPEAVPGDAGGAFAQEAAGALAEEAGGA
ncbi:hypothetical protein [Streptosporangium sandarakinum]|uniref:Uncharacterized protein n=1 Tax=Streptosporangium sandarakinum TaxID=1260955 RepID=A0A852UW95_9ACTN|nr:hypothetical protein [Streptosporangium sandarakinum]NYF37915.1 hypothetical protein [Streptosporangium sandarakinum]